MIHDGSNAPLRGLKAAVSAAGVAAAYAGRLLSVLGAETVMLEPPDGTPLRGEPPFLDAHAKVSALFAYLAAGMHSFVCDTQTEQGRAEAFALLSEADIFIDDTPLAERERRGLGQASIAARHPHLVHVSVLPFGATGPKANWKAEEINLLHASGEGNLLPNGLCLELFPERPPVKIYGHFASLQGGAAAALGALSALWVREEAGGQFVDISIQDAALAVSAFAVQRFGDGTVEHRTTRSFRYGGVLPCADGYVELLTLEQHQWKALVEFLGRPDWSLDPALGDPLERGRQGTAINARIRSWAKDKRAAAIVERGQALGVPVAKYNTPAEVLADPHERARGLFAPVTIEGVGVCEMLVSPFHFDGKPLTLDSGPPALGSHPIPRKARPASVSRGLVKAGPLGGIRIADFTVHAAGPFCTHLLSQLGAECIKVESAMRPDIFRKPHPVYGRMGPASFDQVASNKLSIRINLKHPKGVALAKRLASISDIAAESFRPGVLKRLGLGYEALRAAKVEIILLSVSSSGQTGPDSHFAGYAPLFGAWGGLGALTGFADGPPIEIRHVMDHSAGLNAAAAVVAALHRRRATGEGQHVDVAAREVASSLIGEALLQAAAGGVPVRMGNDHPSMAPHGVYPSQGKDCWIAIAVANDEEWRALAGVMGLGELARDARFCTAACRLGNRNVLDGLICRWSASLPAGEAAALLQAAGVAAHPSWTAQEIVADEHLRVRRAIFEAAEPNGRRRAAVGVPVRMSKAGAPGVVRGTPCLGEHEDYVYGELLGMGRAEREALQDEEVIF
jgi:crotonobetainyl-CoA:carnitine CoA-transferase CaiB-like acyl-CoA transferase